MTSLLLAALLAAGPETPGAGDAGAWTTVRLTDAFTAEGAAAADFDGDGHVDLAVGPTLYRGPDWTDRTLYKPPVNYSPLTYSEEFLTFAADLTGDGRPDMISVGWPGKATVWYENPGSDRDYRSEGYWTKHLLAPVVDNESPGLADLVGDERPELIGPTGRRLRLLRPGRFRRRSRGGGGGSSTPSAPPTPGRGKIPRTGWASATSTATAGPTCSPKTAGTASRRRPTATRCGRRNAVPFAGRAAQLLPIDADGDGDADVVTARDAHGHGPRLVGEPRRRRGLDPPRNHGRRRRQRGLRPIHPAARAWRRADVNGDGLTDFVTGKRFFAHGPDGDPDPLGDPVLYWWELTRGAGGENGDGPRFVPHLIHADSGVGTQVTVGDVTGDGRPDVLVGNKRGAFLSVRE